jgi:hypothetical protein
VLSVDEVWFETLAAASHPSWVTSTSTSRLQKPGLFLLDPAIHQNHWMHVHSFPFFCMVFIRFNNLRDLDWFGSNSSQRWKTRIPQ